LFGDQIGLAPKLYCLAPSLSTGFASDRSRGPLDWAAVALAGAYCDQAHLAGELRDFSCIHAE
jgi:hypothetical protein